VSSSIPNPSVSGQTIYLYQPAGTVAAPTGGTCGDNSRPVAIVVHGLLAGNPGLYQGIIDHLVSKGNIVVFATYNTDASNFVGSFTAEDGAIVAATNNLTRDDLTRVGIIGHSMGGGAIPFLMQRIGQRNWGTNGLWGMALAPWQIAGVEATGSISIPSNAQVVVEAYQDDTLVSRSVGVSMYNRWNLPASQKQHVTVRGQSHGGVTLQAVHTTPNSIIAPEDAMKFFGIFRIADALQSCSQQGQNCTADFSFMGTWSDGTPVTPALSTDSPT
jgi:hypothetical protein